MNDDNAILLSTVTDVFFIEGRGCVIVPGVPHPSATIPVIRRGASITLRRPDGTEIQSCIQALETIRRHPPALDFPILLPPPLTKSDVPIGTEVWYSPPSDGTHAPASGE